MLAHPDRMGQLRQPLLDLQCGHRFERRQRGPPPPGVRVVPLAQLGGQLEQPRHPVGPLEAGATGCLEIPDLGDDVRVRQTAGQCGPRGLGELRRRVKPYQPGQQPMGVDRGMPVEAPVEGGGQLARRAHVLIAVQYMRDLVRIFPVNAVERQLGEAAGGQRVWL